MRYLNVYEVGRAYGGPEEGGWWYDIGDPVKSSLIGLVTDEQLDALIAEARVQYPYTGKRDSVLGGEDYDVRVEDHPARAYPTERPRYE